MTHNSEHASATSNNLDRRKFLGATAATAGWMILNPSLVRGTDANSAVRVGLLGCGGRGTEDATNLVDTGSARVTALADLFPDQLEAARKHFDELQQSKNIPALDPKQLFVGPNAYHEILASKEIDAIVIATPPYFHPMHLEAAVAAGKHVYIEKPVAVDVPGALKVIDIGKKAEGKLSLDVGFQIRDCPPFVEMVRRIHAGAIGKIVCGEAHYLTGYISRPQWPAASPDERRLRNWIYDRVLSGDIIVEQNIHVIDICNWVLKSHPLKVSGTSSRAGRPVDGDVMGNYNVVFQYPGGVDITFSSTQFAKGWWDVTERFFGTKGTSQSPYIGPLGIWGDEPWQDPSSTPKDAGQQQAFSVTGNFRSNLEQADPEKKKAFVESILSGKFHNQTAAGAESALSCMMARMAAYTGREVTWEETLKSKEVWDAKLDLNKIVAKA
ncbi:MAG: Gfo/Idh/MocA family oxidoreductase [Candidatus Acidiferrum sp.]